MKNIHVLPTDKPSRLYTNMQGVLSKDELKMRLKNYNIYITSDEEIKIGEYYLCKLSMKPLKCIGDEYFNNIDEKKIILTTDQDLIKDGVQAIDDEFLEWFVKNPSCEEVDVKNPLIANVSDFGYKIIIPKEEPNPFELQKTLPDDVFYESLEPKQETLEEACERLTQDYNGDLCQKLIAKTFITVGVKWQQEQDKNKYSEEELRDMLQSYVEWAINGYGTYYDWFEQFKKK